VWPIELGPITPRLFAATDFDEFFAYWGLPSVARYVRWRPNDEAEDRAGLARRIASNRLDEWVDLLVFSMLEDEWRAGRST
jgi:RimJ/RimL family protein N-acetyltransferase